MNVLEHIFKLNNFTISIKEIGDIIFNHQNSLSLSLSLSLSKSKSKSKSKSIYLNLSL